MNERSLRVGSVSLLFAVLLSCTALLALLTVMTARADALITARYAQSIQARYAHEAEAEEWTALAIAAYERGEKLPEPAVEQAEAITADFGWEDGTALHIELTPAGDTLQKTAHLLTVEREPELHIDNLWAGPGR